MEEDVIKKLYREYLEEVLKLKYKRMVIARETLKYNSKYFLKVQSFNGDCPYEKFDSLIELENGNYLGNSGSTYVFFDSEGKELKRIENVKIDSFCNGFARIISRDKMQLCGYIDMNGKMVSEMKWGSGSRDFQCGMAMVAGVQGNALGKYGYIDETGKLVIPFSSTRCYSFSDDVCCMEHMGKNYYYNKEGKELFSDPFTSPYFHNGLVGYSDGINGGFKNKKGETVFKIKTRRASSFNNGLAKCDKGYVNLEGDYVRVSCLDDGVPYIKGIFKPSYYNSLKDEYDKLECIPYKDLGDYLLCVSKSSEMVLYSKESGIYTQTNLQYTSGDVSVIRKGNLLELNNNVFYLNPNGCICLSTVLDLVNVSSLEDADVVSYDTFSSNIRKDKSYFDRIISENKELKAKKIQDEVDRAKTEEDKRRQIIIEQLSSLKAELTKLDSGAGSLSKIDADILFRQVDDHLEVNAEFTSQLKYLDLSCIDFTGVKVSGLDFSGSNASINPQLVYNKDMSYGNYDGLCFISSNFDGVNITGASFDGCVMDFAIMNGCINNEDNKYSGK